MRNADKSVTSGMKDPFLAYQTDDVFRAYVDHLVAFVMNADLSPSEIRRGAVLACIKVEHMTLNRPLVLRAEEARDLGLEIIP